ncbi:MAG: RsmE family RNA methyltransferase [Candidatus Gastranaerophilales bacterium]
MPHFFINSKQIIDNKLTISDKENFTHIAKSLRAKIDEKFLFIDENKIQHETIIKNITKQEIFFLITNSYPSNKFLEFNLCLAQTPLRSDAQNTIIEKATELGVNIIYPIQSDNCALAKNIIDKKIERWQRIMLEASKQCERADIPECKTLTSLEKLLNNNKFDKIIAFCERKSELNLKKYLNLNPIKKGENILAIIGPEGGFSQKEFDFFITNKIPMISLGELILKAETAAIVALGNIVYEYNNK